MNFKIISAVLAVALVATIVFYQSKPTASSCELSYLDGDGKSMTIDQKKLDEIFGELNRFNEVFSFTQKEIEEMEKDLAEFDSTDGEFLPVPKAGEHWRSFRDWNKQRFNFRKEIVPNGFAFGLQRVRQLMAFIDSENARRRQSNQLDSLILGVRVNLTHNKPGNGRRIDALIVPIIKGGKNYIDLNNPEQNNFLEGNSALNTSTPCPDLCNY